MVVIWLHYTCWEGHCSHWIWIQSQALLDNICPISTRCYNEDDFIINCLYHYHHQCSTSTFAKLLQAIVGQDMVVGHPLGDFCKTSPFIRGSMKSDQRQLRNRTDLALHLAIKYIYAWRRLRMWRFISFQKSLSLLIQSHV